MPYQSESDEYQAQKALAIVHAQRMQRHRAKDPYKMPEFRAAYNLPPLPPEQEDTETKMAASGSRRKVPGGMPRRTKKVEYTLTRRVVSSAVERRAQQAGYGGQYIPNPPKAADMKHLKYSLKKAQAEREEKRARAKVLRDKIEAKIRETHPGYKCYWPDVD